MDKFVGKKYVLRAPNRSKKITVYVDASDDCISGALIQVYEYRLIPNL